MGQSSSINSVRSSLSDSLPDNESSTSTGSQSSCSDLDIVEKKTIYPNKGRHTILATNNKVKLLSLRPINESHELCQDSHHRQSVKNLIFGDTTGPRFSQDLCSISSAMSDYSFGIEFSPCIGDDSPDDSCDVQEQQDKKAKGTTLTLPEYLRASSSTRGNNYSSKLTKTNNWRDNCHVKPLAKYPSKAMASSRLSSALTLASVDLNSFESDTLQVMKPGQMSQLMSRSEASLLTRNLYGNYTPLDMDLSSFDQDQRYKQQQQQRHPVDSSLTTKDGATRLKLPLFTRKLLDNINCTTGRACKKPIIGDKQQRGETAKINPLHETKLIILLQVCLPFILAGFGNLAAGFVVKRIVTWPVFQRIPAFLILLTSFVGFKGNIEMTMASRLSSLANLGMLDTNMQIMRAYIANLFLVWSQAISLSFFSGLLALAIEFLFILPLNGDHVLILLASGQLSALILVTISSVLMILAIIMAKMLSVNPDNLSTLISALYGDVSAVYIYACVANYIFVLFTLDNNIITTTGLTINNSSLVLTIIICGSLIIWPLATVCACRLDETRAITLTSIIPITLGIFVSLLSGYIFSQVYRVYTRISLYHPVVNGFGANLIAVQASRVSTWLWCSTLNKLQLNEIGGHAASRASNCINNNNNNNMRKLSSLNAKHLHSTGSIRVKYLGKTNPYMHQGTNGDEHLENLHDEMRLAQRNSGGLNGAATNSYVVYNRSQAIARDNSNNNNSSNVVAVEGPKGITVTNFDSSNNNNNSDSYRGQATKITSCLSSACLDRSSSLSSPSQNNFAKDNNDNNKGGNDACRSWSDDGKKKLLSLLSLLNSRLVNFSRAIFRALFWSFLGPSPNAKAAKMLLVMMIVAQSIYFFVIYWLQQQQQQQAIRSHHYNDAIHLTISFYATYILICFIQVGLLLMICEPLMTLLMSRNFDPDTYGITLLMACADLLGTICLAQGFWILTKMHDPNGGPK